MLSAMTFAINARDYRQIELRTSKPRAVLKADFFSSFLPFLSFFSFPLKNREKSTKNREKQEPCAADVLNERLLKLADL